jgi:hypothetical protein
MPVDIQTVPTGTQPITFFSDTLQTVDPNSATGLGSNWNFAVKTFSPYNSGDHVIAIPSIGASSFDGANALIWSSKLFGAAAQWRSAVWPNKDGLYQRLFGNTQFVQVNPIKISGNWNPSIACCYYSAEPNGLTGYHLDMNGAGGGGANVSWRIRRSVADSYTTLVSSGVNVNVNQLWRFSANLNTSAQVVLTFTAGGTAVTSFTDTGASIITIGSPSICVLVPDNLGTGALELRSFSCGLGT